MADEDGHRVITKMDCGPGQFGKEFLSRAHVEGLSSFPGLPNGTEVGKEMDQIFSAFKPGYNDPRQQQQQNELSALSTMAISGRGSSFFRYFTFRSTN
jgi:hypothetical protein